MEVSINALVEVLNGVENSLKDALKEVSPPPYKVSEHQGAQVISQPESTQQSHIGAALMSVQDAITKLLMLG